MTVSEYLQKKKQDNPDFATLSDFSLYEKLQSWFKKVGVERISMTHYSWSPYIGEFYKKDGYVPYDINYVKVLKEES